MPQALTVQDPGHRLVQDACFSSAQTLGSRCSAHRLRPCGRACPILARLFLTPVVEVSTTPLRPGPGPQGRNAPSARRVGWALPASGDQGGHEWAWAVVAS